MTRRRPAALAAATITPLARTLLRLLWEAREVSRAELARRAGLSRSSVSEVVPALLATALVEDGGTGVSSGGRRPVLLRFRDDAFHVLGLALGATHVDVALVDLRGTVRSWRRRDHPVQADPAGTRALLARLCREALAEAALPPDRLLGVGAALPSPVDPRHPERLHPLTLPAWRQEHGLGEVAARLGVPALIDNDANLGALAERWWGAARGIDDFTYLHLATGVGAGHFLGGRLYRGAAGVAGEAGHLSIDPHGPPCNCGNRGCLWTYVGAPHLVARVRALLPDHPDSALAASALAGAPPDPGALVRAALADDPLALRVVREAAEQLGVVVVNIVNLLNPTVVVVGGSLARLGERLLAPLRAAVGRRTFESTAILAGLHASALGERNIALGAATLVLDALLADPWRFPAVAAAGALPATRP